MKSAKVFVTMLSLVAVLALVAGCGDAATSTPAASSGNTGATSGQLSGSRKINRSWP